MKVLCVIPVRMASTRLPGKPLKDIGGKNLVQRVYEQAQKASRFSSIVVATDSQEIQSELSRLNIEVLMTSSEARTGSDRVCEAYKNFKKNGSQFDVVVNLQGDMPFIRPEVIDGAIESFQGVIAEYDMGTIATPITEREEFFRPSCVKVACGKGGRALYFSRAPIPFPREESRVKGCWGHKHLGFYMFKPQALEALALLQSAEVEEREGLEQLRALAQGINIHVSIIARDLIEPSIEVDTPEDLDRARAICAS